MNEDTQLKREIPQRRRTIDQEDVTTIVAVIVLFCLISVGAVMRYASGYRHSRRAPISPPPSATMPTLIPNMTTGISAVSSGDVSLISGDCWSSLMFDDGQRYCGDSAFNDTLLGNTTTIRVTGSAEITGLGQGTDGREVTVVNVGSGVPTLHNEDTRSVSRDRLALLAEADWALVGNTTVTLVYDAASERWRMVGSSTRYAGDH